MSFEKIGAPRLLQLAEILDETGYYNQESWFRGSPLGNECGTPACALGHWAAANREKWRTWDGAYPVLREMISECDDAPICGNPISTSTAREFFINPYEHAELFGGTGCGFAGSDNHAAAAYIRDFVFRKLKCPEAP